MVFTKFAKYQICQISNTKHYLIFELPVPQYSFVMVLIVLIIIIAVLSIHLTFLSFLTGICLVNSFLDKFLINYFLKSFLNLFYILL